MARTDQKLFIVTPKNSDMPRLVKGTLRQVEQYLRAEYDVAKATPEQVYDMRDVKIEDATEEL